MARQRDIEPKHATTAKAKKLTVKREPLRDLKTTPTTTGRVRGGRSSSGGSYTGSVASSIAT